MLTFCKGACKPYKRSKPIGNSLNSGVLGYLYHIPGHLRRVGKGVGVQRIATSPFTSPAIDLGLEPCLLHALTETGPLCSEKPPIFMLFVKARPVLRSQSVFYRLRLKKKVPVGFQLFLFLNKFLTTRHSLHNFFLKDLFFNLPLINVGTMEEKSVHNFYFFI